MMLLPLKKHTHEHIDIILSYGTRNRQFQFRSKNREIKFVIAINISDCKLNIHETGIKTLVEQLLFSFSNYFI